MAVNDLMRLREFIAIKNPQSARRYSQSLKNSLNSLTDHPQMGRLLDEGRHIRELIVGNYIARYRVMDDRVIVFKIRHSKEAVDI